MCIYGYKNKSVNSGNICDICKKLNFTINYTHFITTDTYVIKTRTDIIIFDTFDRTVLLRDLGISALHSFSINK